MTLEEGMKARRFEVPPVWERIARSLTYLMVGFGGLYGLYGPLPKSLDMALHPSMTYVWVGFMAIGFICSWAALKQLWLVEYGLALFPIGALFAYAVAMASVTVSGDNPGSGIAMFLVTGFGCGLTSRWVSLSQLVGQPPWRLKKISKGG